jgi:hypothetical protein
VNLSLKERKSIKTKRKLTHVRSWSSIAKISIKDLTKPSRSKVTLL